VCVEAGQPAASIEPADGLNVPGLVTIGPAVRVTSTGETPHGIDVVVPFEPGKLPKGQADELIVVLQRGRAPAHAALVSNVTVEVELGRLHLHLAEAPRLPVVLQVALRSDVSATPTPRLRTYRAIGGVSMGGFGASVNGWGRTDRFDALAILGADPGPDLTYSLRMIYDWMMAGFCTAPDDGAQKIGQLCAPRRVPLGAQFERGQSFEAMLTEKGEGTGLTLRRDLYLRALRDLSRAVGNPAYPYVSGGSPYLPPGVEASFVSRQPSDVCANPVRLKGFFDRRYNPDAAFDVITFCDGNDSSKLGNAVFDPSVPAVNPPQVLLAVDVNGNGVRDSGEPVVIQAEEPFSDVGTDGMASKDEPGYDPVTNPDPSGDDYHYLWNPTGLEGNWRYDQGEPFQDSGTDGVAQKGCPLGSAAGCYDFGEGNGRHDLAEGHARWRALDPRALVESLPDETLRAMRVYYDAGIRDFFNAQVSTNSLLAALAARNQPVRAWENFTSLVGLALNQEVRFDAKKITIDTISPNMYVRYGDPDLPQSVIEATGDGRHAGATAQVIHRAQSLFTWMTQLWPDGDKTPGIVESERSRIDGTLTTASGRQVPYTVVLPPGYFDPKNETLRYPVLYLGHGYGMGPGDLGTVALIANQLMADPSLPPERRLPKFIFVMVDAMCRPGGDVRRGPLPTEGDLCEEGAFYVDHPEGVYKGSTLYDELEAMVSSSYRTRAPEVR
jgi:hypothetical protein